MDTRLMRAALALLGGGTLGAVMAAGANHAFQLPIGWTLPAGMIIGGAFGWLCCDFHGAWVGLQRAWKEAMAELKEVHLFRPSARNALTAEQLGRGWGVFQIELQEFGLILLLVGSYAIIGFAVAWTLGYLYPAEAPKGLWGSIAVALFLIGWLSVIVFAVALLVGLTRIAFILGAYRFPRLNTGRGWWYKHSFGASIAWSAAGRNSVLELLLASNSISAIIRLMVWIRAMMPIAKKLVCLSFRYIHTEFRLMVFVDSGIGAAIGWFLGSFDLVWSLIGGLFALAAGAINYFFVVPRLGVIPR